MKLIETRKRLGGRATSFTDPTTGQTLDNCQHVLMGCCTNLLDLYHRLGVGDAIEWHPKLYFMNLGDAAVARYSNNGDAPPIDTLEADDLPAPLHMTRALMAFSQLTLSEKVAISRAMFAIMRLSVKRRNALHTTSFAQWLTDHGQPQGAIEKFWAPVVISALNETPENCAADYAIHVYQDGFLSSADAYVMGLSRVPLVELYDAAEKVITQAGGELMLSTSAERFIFEGERITALQLADGSLVESDIFISALPFDRLAKICPPEMYKADLRLRRLDRFTTSPIIGIHLWFDCPHDEPVMDLPHLTLTQSPLQWIFSKGLEERPQGISDDFAAAANAGLAPPSGKKCQHLHGVISAAQSLVEFPADHIIDLIVAEVRKALPRARQATLLHARVIKEKRATFAPKPGVDVMRPTAGGGIANLYLAGDWCRTGWPATMEGAVRSGYLAASAAERDAGDAETPDLVPDLPAEMMYRLIQW